MSVWYIGLLFGVGTYWKKEGPSFDFEHDKKLLFLSREFRTTLKNSQPSVQRALVLIHRPGAAGE
jgi:hypothetical protein